MQEQWKSGAISPSEGASAEKTLAEGTGLNLNMLMGVALQVRIRFGQTTLSLRAALELQPGVLVDLRRPVGEPVEVLVHDRPIAQGEIVMVDGNYAVRIQRMLHRGNLDSPRGETESARVPAGATTSREE